MNTLSQTPNFRHPRVKGHQVFRRLVIAVAAISMLAVLVPFSPSASAQAQNEMVVQLNWDGTVTDGAPLPGDCVLPIVTVPHTPGEDADSCNGVIQTYDLLQYRVDYNVNEEAQTNTEIVLELPANMTWVAPDGSISAANPAGMFAGCLAGSTITSTNAPGLYNTVGTNDILTCIVDTADHEGNNGTIYPTAQLLAEVDNAVLTMTATMNTDEQPAAVVGFVDVVASSFGIPEFVKGPLADVEYDVDNNGVAGLVFFYPITFNVPGGVIGSPPIDDTVDIAFYDHAWSIGDASIGVELATGLVPGRTACGAYDGGGSYPLNTGTWTTCALDQAATAANDYPVIEMVLDGGSWSAIDVPDTNADGARGCSHGER